MDDVLHAEIEGPVATVWLNRPKVRNALNALLIGGLRDAMTSLDANPAIAAIVLTGADPAFCSGARPTRSRQGTLGGGGSASPIPADMGTPGIEAATGSAMKRLYWTAGSVTPAEGPTVEREVNRSWTERSGFDRSAFADRRGEIEARGRGQVEVE